MALAVYGIAFVTELWLEAIGRVDSIGIWYTGLVAAFYAGLVLAVVLVLTAVWRLMRGRSDDQRGDKT